MMTDVRWEREESFGEHLKDLRMRAKMSLDGLAEKTRIAVWLLDRYEKDYEIPKRPVVHKIARALQCDAFWLLQWRDTALTKRRMSR